MEDVNMNKLNIVQSSNSVETVTTQIIDQLYNAALSVSEPEEGETDQAYMSGHISVDHAYDAKVKYLAGTIGEGSSGVVTSIQQNAQGRFQDLRIDVTNGLFISFEDPNVKSICETTWGNGGGVTTSTLATVTALNEAFRRNTNIVNFDEFKYFTALTIIPTNTFSDCTSLEKLTLPNTTIKLNAWSFENTNLSKLNVENITELDDNVFGRYNNSDSVDKICNNDVLNFKELVTVGYSLFGRCDIKEVYMPKLQSTCKRCNRRDWWTGWPQFGRGRGCWFYCGLMYFRDLTKVYSATFSSMTCTALVINNITPPEWANTNDATDSESLESEHSKETMFDGSTFGGGDTRGNFVVYVPDSAITTYQNHTYWGTFCSIHGISEINSGVIYDTYDDWVGAGKPIALIRDYM